MDIKDLIRSDLLSFCMAMNNSYSPGSVHRKIARDLMAVERGELRFLIINMPPRHGKTMLTSEFFPAWFLGHNPKKQIIFTAYSQEFADGVGRTVRNHMNSEEYRTIFPDVRVATDSNASNRFHTEMQGVYYAVGAGGALTGRGADLLIIDDPIKNDQDARSRSKQENLKKWFQWTAQTRLMPNGAIIVIQTRWSDDDLAGWLIREQPKKWKVLSLPAIDEHNNALWPERFSLETLLEMRKEMDSRGWASLYQQNPVPEDGSIFKNEWLRYYYQQYDIQDYEKIIQSWDTANKDHEFNDPSCCITFGIRKNEIHILNVFTRKMEYPELKKNVLSQAQIYTPHAILIEDKSSGQSLISELQRSSSLPIIPREATVSKVVRAHAVTPLVESGRVFLPEKADFLAAFESELLRFPFAKHDDQVDAFTHGLSYIAKNHTYCDEERLAILKSDYEDIYF